MSIPGPGPDSNGPDSRAEFLIQGIKPIIQVEVKPLPVLPPALETLLYNNNMSLIMYFIHISWVTVYLVVDPTGSGHRRDQHLCPERVSIPIVFGREPSGNWVMGGPLESLPLN